MIAYCYANRVIGFGRTTPEGALPIAKAPARKLRPLIEAISRHGYTPGVLLVPGIPEADSQFKALEALRSFRQWVTESLKKKEAA